MLNVFLAIVSIQSHLFGSFISWNSLLTQLPKCFICNCLTAIFLNLLFLAIYCLLRFWNLLSEIVLIHYHLFECFIFHNPLLTQVPKCFLCNCPNSLPTFWIFYFLLFSANSGSKFFLCKCPYSLLSFWILYLLLFTANSGSKMFSPQLS